MLVPMVWQWPGCPVMCHGHSLHEGVRYLIHDISLFDITYHDCIIGTLHSTVVLGDNLTACSTADSLHVSNVSVVSGQPLCTGAPQPQALPLCCSDVCWDCSCPALGGGQWEILRFFSKAIVVLA